MTEALLPGGTQIRIGANWAPLCRPGRDDETPARDDLTSGSQDLGARGLRAKVRATLAELVRPARATSGLGDALYGADSAATPWSTGP